MVMLVAVEEMNKKETSKNRTYSLIHTKKMNGKGVEEERV